MEVIQIQKIGLPQWLSGKESAANGGDMGLIPGPGSFHMPWSKLVYHSCRAYTLQPLKPAGPRACDPHKRSHSNEKPTHHN